MVTPVSRLWDFFSKSHGKFPHADKQAGFVNVIAAFRKEILVIISRRGNRAEDCVTILVYKKNPGFNIFLDHTMGMGRSGFKQKPVMSCNHARLTSDTET